MKNNITNLLTIVLIVCNIGCKKAPVVPCSNTSALDYNIKDSLTCHYSNLVWYVQSDSLGGAAILPITVYFESHKVGVIRHTTYLAPQNCSPILPDSIYLHYTLPDDGLHTWTAIQENGQSIPKTIQADPTMECIPIKIN